MHARNLINYSKNYAINFFIYFIVWWFFEIEVNVVLSVPNRVVFKRMIESRNVSQQSAYGASVSKPVVGVFMGTKPKIERTNHAQTRKASNYAHESR